MISVDLEKPDYIELVKLLAEHFKASLNGNLLIIPPVYGQGYVWAEKLPMGMTVLVSDFTMKQEFSFDMVVSSNHYFSLQFNEYTSVASNKGNKASYNRNALQHQSAVILTNTSALQTFVMPMDVSLQTVRFFFNKEQLGQLMGVDAMEEVLTKFLPFLLTHENLDPIETGYRETLNELLVQKFDVPLRLNFIQNRVFLLLEKFIIKLSGRKDIESGKAKRNYDETLRLMKVESLLVKNFVLPAPTIDELSRISAMSPTKLKNDFKRMYGLPIYSYRQKNRMLKAKSLLLSHQYSIQEVGIMVGYSNLSHFAKSFKKEFRVLPSELSSKDGVLVYNT